MKKLVSLSFLVLLAFALVLTGCGNKEETTKEETSNTDGATKEPAGEKIKIVAAHNQTSPDNPYQSGLLAFKEAAESQSNGSIEVEVHAGTLGTDEAELLQKLQLGGADVVLVSPGFMSQTGIKEIDLLALPYLFDSYEHWEKVVDGEVGEEMARLINENSNNDFKLIGYWTAGVRHYYGKKPLNSIEDIKGMTIRTQTSGVVAEYWQAIGAIPTSVAWGELYQALQQNVVDSAENAYPYYVQQNHHKTDNGKYTTETGHDYTTRFLLINGKKFDSYTQEQKDIILAAAKASVEAERQALYDQEEEYKEKLLAEGGEVNEIDRTPFIEVAVPLHDKAAAEMGAEDLLQIIRDLK